VNVQYGYGTDSGIETSPPGTLQFDVVSPHVAIGAAGQEVSLGCNDTGGDGGFFSSGEGGMMPITASSLVVIGSTLVLSFTGTMGAGTGCDSATQAVILVCQ
jgi:hypothetical protein